MARFLTIAVALIVLLAGSAIMFVLVAPAYFVEKGLAAALGREVTLEAASTQWSWDFAPVFTLSGLTVANADWAEADNFIEAEQVAAKVALLPLLAGGIDMPLLVVRGASLDLVRRADGSATWAIGSDGEGSSSADVISGLGDIQIADGTYVLRDEIMQINAAGGFETTGGDGDTRRLSLTANGDFNGEALAGQLTLGNIKAMALGDPIPLDGALDAGAHTLSVSGQVDDLDTEAFSITFSLSGPDLASTFPLFGVPLPETPPYALTGTLTRDDEVWGFTDFGGTVGDSDLSGDIKIDTAPTPPRLTGTLSSSRLDFDDLAGLVGAPPATGEGESANADQTQMAADAFADGRLIPDTPIDIERLNAMDMQVAFSGDVIEAPGMPLSDVSFTLDLAGGVAVFDPLAFTFRQGKAAGAVTLDASGNVPHADIRLSLSDIGLKPFFETTAFGDETSGAIRGELKLSGHGGSVDALAANSSGYIGATTVDATLSGLVLELLDLDIAETLAIAFTEDGAVPVRCAGIRFGVTAGEMVPEVLIIDTRDSRVAGEGKADLGAETLDFTFNSDPKDFSLLSANAPIKVTGTFVDPGFGLGGVPFPFPDFGGGEDVNCASLEARALGEG